MKTKTILGMSLIAASLALAGCNESYSMSAEAVTDPPIAASIDGDAMGLSVGIAVGFEAIPKKDGDEMDRDTDFDLVSNDPTIVRVAKTTKRRHFVIYGVSAGEGTISMLVDGREELLIPVSVDPQ